MTQFPSALLALALVYALSGFTHGLLGIAFGSLVDFVPFCVIFYYVNRYLRELRDG